MITLHNLRKHYAGRTVLSIEDHSFASGKVHMVVGCNGSGKTTLLRLVARLEKPDAGAIAADVETRECLFCPQRPYMFRGSVIENLRYGPRVRGRTLDRAEIAKAAKSLGVEHLLERNARCLSAGETQRVALARALLCRPRLLLLDEPLANLDTASAAAIRATLGELRDREVTVLVATHVGDRAALMADEVLRLECGRIVHPELNNIFEGDIEGEDEGRRLRVNAVFAPRVVTRRTGRVRAALPSAEIAVSREPTDAGADNEYRGHAVGIRRVGGAVELAVDVGVPLVTAITEESLGRMGITVGTPLVASFKATAVCVF